MAWISTFEIAKNGIKDNYSIGKGASKHSLSINNPELLISFLIPDFNNKNKVGDYFSEADYFLPKKLIWDKKKNTLKAYFDIKSFFEKNPEYMGIEMFTDETNARDMGYNWIYCEKYENIKFSNENNNISMHPYEMKGYYHKGYSCGLEAGCNNYSPYQNEMPFRIFASRAYLKLKLWKNKPVSKFQRADIIYEMYL